MFWDTVLYILAILGIVLIGAILVFLLAKLFIDGFKDEQTSQGLSSSTKSSGTKKKNIRPKVLDTNELDEEESFVKNEIDTNQPQHEVKTWDEAMAEEEKNASLTKSTLNNGLFSDNKSTSSQAEKDFDDFDDIFNEPEANSGDKELSDKEIADLIDKVNVESIAEYKEMYKPAENKKETNVEIAEPVEKKDVESKKEETVVKSDFDDFDDFGGFDKFEDENNIKEIELEDVATEKVNEMPEEDLFKVDYEQEKAEIEQEKQAIAEQQAEIEQQRADLEEQRKQLEEEKARIEELKEQQANTIVVDDLSSIYSSESLDQLEVRLEVLEERLKQNKKDLKENRREYKPLERVKKTLEKDKAKLTRKEAIVARQKVILYGVNNYVDIDEEKAKKLNEELDLLDGLRLSVQHCEEVMNANKDRYPILEKTNRILTKINAELLSDIEEVTKAIESKKNA